MSGEMDQCFTTIQALAFLREALSNGSCRFVDSSKIYDKENTQCKLFYMTSSGD